jgi:hypothetical protein
VGTFSTSDDAPSCSAWSNCPEPSQYESSAPSESADRQCGTCVLPELTLAENETDCVVPVFQMSGGRVVMEAEHFHVQETNDSVHAWELRSAPLASGAQCMKLNPEAAYSWTSPIGFAPQLDFRVNFTTTGMFYVHLRGDSGTDAGASDSVYAGIDNALMPEFDFDDQAAVWGWRTQGISVGSMGQHTVSVWGREDGFSVDKIVVSTSATPPTGDGPVESPQR